MGQIDSLCMGCMKDNGGESLCPLCGYRENTPQLAPLLPVKTILESRYIVGQVIGVNGEGVSYMGYDLNTNVIVKIKEYFPENLSSRAEGSNKIVPIPGCEDSFAHYMNVFKLHAKSLARIREVTAIAPLYDIFEVNSTAYTVSEHVEGVTLAEYVVSNGGNMSWEQARVFFMPVLNCLTVLHDAGIMHLGITPNNLIIAKDGKMKLVGFAISAIRMSRTDLHAELTAGFSAFEQYGYEGGQGAWTDIYGFCASLYTALTGQVMSSANKRSIHDKIILPSNVVLPTHVVKALEKGLEVASDDRIRNFEQLRAELSAAPTAQTMTNTATFVAPPKKAKKAKKRNGITYMLASMLGVLVVILIIIFIVVNPFINGDKGSSSVTSIYVPPSPTSSKAAAPSKTSVAADYDAPGLVGKNYTTVKSDSNYERFKIVVGGYEFDDALKKDEIKSQNPQVGSPINRGDTITVTLSLGPRMRRLPSITNKTLNEAKILLLENGFEIGDVKEIFDANVAEGLVVRTGTDHVQGDKYEYGTKIDIFYSGFKDRVTGSDEQPEE